MVIGYNNNNNIHISIQPQGRNFRGGDRAGQVMLVSVLQVK